MVSREIRTQRQERSRRRGKHQIHAVIVQRCQRVEHVADDEPRTHSHHPLSGAVAVVRISRSVSSTLFASAVPRLRVDPQIASAEWVSVFTVCLAQTVERVTPHLRLASLAHLVVVVLARRARVEMVRVDAARIVASVHNHVAVTNLANKMLVCPSVRLDVNLLAVFSVLELAVTVPVCRTDPQPTATHQ